MPITTLNLRNREQRGKRLMRALRMGSAAVLVCSAWWCGGGTRAQQATPTGAVANASASAAAGNAGDNPPGGTMSGDSIGVIEGEAIAVSGPMSVEVVHGQVRTVLRSGSDVRVKSGSARIDLVEGGLITICGPAHLSVLKAAGAVTVALDNGTIHLHVGRTPILTVYTPQIKAQPIAIGDAEQDLLVGFDTPGAMCVRALRGAVRLEQQLSGQSVVIPQLGDVLLMNGSLDSLTTSSGGKCLCELGELDALPKTLTQAPSAEQVSQLATAEDVRKRNYDAKPELPARQAPAKLLPNEEPIYHVIVPPLVYMANGKNEPTFDASMIILVRRVRVRPTVIFQGRVLEAPTTVQAALLPAVGVGAGKENAAVPAAVTAKPAAKPAAAPAANPSVVERVKSFISNLWGKP